MKIYLTYLILYLCCLAGAVYSLNFCFEAYKSNEISKATYRGAPLDEQLFSEKKSSFDNPIFTRHAQIEALASAKSPRKTEVPVKIKERHILQAKLSLSPPNPVIEHKDSAPPILHKINFKKKTP